MMIINQGDQDLVVQFKHVRDTVPVRTTRKDLAGTEDSIVGTVCTIKTGPKGTPPKDMAVLVESSAEIARDKKTGILKDNPDREKGRRVSLTRALKTAFPRYGSTNAHALETRTLVWKSYFDAQGVLDESGTYVGK